MNKSRYTTRNRYPVSIVALLAILFTFSVSAQAADEQAAAKEKTLIETLRTGADADKAIACKQLAIYGSKAAVPDLAALLSNEQLNSWARIPLEVIPGPEADEALRKAIDSLQGRLLVGTINSVGVRADAGAVPVLTARLKDQNADVASAAAVALGKIGNAAATETLRKSLAGAPPKVKSAVAEGCILCAERLMLADKGKEATEIYDEVRKSDAPKQRVLEATRGAILARKAAGVPLLVETLKSKDRGVFNIGLFTARELPGREAADALALELVGTSPERAALLLDALADRKDATLPPAVLEAIKSGPKPLRIAAIGVVGRLGDDTSIATLLQIAADNDAELAQAAKAALIGLKGEKVNGDLAKRLPNADGKALPILIELVGQRRIDATEPLVKALGHPDAAIRGAALTALGETVSSKDLPVLITQAVTPKFPGDAQVAKQALRAACVRMPEREACAAQLAAAMSNASVPTKANILEILGAMGGPKALETIGAAAKGSDAELQDAGSRVLGEWMSVDAGPTLLELAKSSDNKYQVRALRGYIRLARQFTMPDAQRAEMCQKALDASARAEEQMLVLAVLQRYANMESLKVAAKATQNPVLKDEATRVSLAIASKLGGKTADARELLAKIGLEPVKVEITKAHYGAGANQKDVTEVLQKHVGSLPLIALPSEQYNTSFGGDPAPNTVKQLKIQYKINGKAGEASFAENATILLPMPK